MQRLLQDFSGHMRMHSWLLQNRECVKCVKRNVDVELVVPSTTPNNSFKFMMLVTCTKADALMLCWPMQLGVPTPHVDGEDEDADADECSDASSAELLHAQPSELKLLEEKKRRC